MSTVPSQQSADRPAGPELKDESVAKAIAAAVSPSILKGLVKSEWFSDGRPKDEAREGPAHAPSEPGRQFVSRFTARPEAREDRPPETEAPPAANFGAAFGGLLKVRRKNLFEQADADERPVRQEFNAKQAFNGMRPAVQQPIARPSQSKAFFE
jgi:hypothetical protein